MPKNLSRYEQLLRVHTLFVLLMESRIPVDDAFLIHAIKERLGLSRLSSRTLHRDCDFLISCGYPLDHLPLPNSRRSGWIINAAAMANRMIPAEPLTILEMAAFGLARDLCGVVAGTVLWTGIESLRTKLERGLPTEFLRQVAAARAAFHIPRVEPSQAPDRPRLIAALAGAINDRRQIEVDLSVDGCPAPTRRVLRPALLFIDPLQVYLAAWPSSAGGDESRGTESDSQRDERDRLEFFGID